MDSRVCCHNKIVELDFFSIVSSDPPKITYFQSSYTVNETNSVSMVCRTEGVPRPTVYWVKTSNEKRVGEGEQFTIANTSGSDDGKYTCNAKNELGGDSRQATLNVQSKQ